MNLEWLGTLGWREGVMTIIGLLVAYIVVLFLRIRRLQSERGAVPPLVAQSAVAAYAAVQEPQPPAPPATARAAPTADLQAEAAAFPSEAASGAAGSTVASVAEEPTSEAVLLAAQQEAIDALQREVYQLRGEVDELREEVLAARDDFRRQRAQWASLSPGTSPLYKDAMQMAAQGHDATTIAHHCGIARAEADLVVAMARSRSEGR